MSFRCLIFDSSLLSSPFEWEFNLLVLILINVGLFSSLTCVIAFLTLVSKSNKSSVVVSMYSIPNPSILFCISPEKVCSVEVDWAIPLLSKTINKGYSFFAAILNVS